MPLRVAVQMDPIERIDIRGDSTFAILLEAQRRGHDIFYYTPQNLALRRRQADGARRDARSAGQGRASTTSCRDPRVEDLAKLRRGAAAPGPAVRHGLHHDDASARAHPPQDAGRQRPGAGAQRAGEDLRARLPRPDAADASSRARSTTCRPSAREYKDIIIKPLYGNGGAAVFRIGQDDTNLGALVELFQTRVPRAVHGAAVPARGARAATSASSSSTARWRAPSTACRRRARRAPTCTSAARRSRPS